MKIENKIIDILRENPELTASDMGGRLGVTYDTAASHLKRMADNKVLTREAKGSPWYYYYSLKNEKEI